MEHQVVDGDLLEQTADAIVNAWNRNIIPWWLLLPQGVSGAIKRRAGLGGFGEERALALITRTLDMLTSAARATVVRFRPR